MARLWKLRQRIEQAPRQVRFEDLDRLLRGYGFEARPPRRGSHYVYFKGQHQITVPYRRPHLLESYVRRALELIDQAQWEEEESER